ncbi:MAG TPA: MBL fold metallo-hydrolase [Candidatus Saccharimonadales bacterium]|nr:MBL fold metallo-hydrolase [Candidatus Saccharimonadales bacterium]
MNIVKYEHACFTVEKDNALLVIDPGEFATDFIAPENVAAIVVTHEHSDHMDTEQLASIIDKNPEAVIFGPESVTSKLESLASHTVTTGDVIAVGPFSLEFHGGHHATIHESIPVIQNLGVFINDLVYYPGDSFTLTHKPVDTLALPVSAPWLKIGEVMDFLSLIKPRLAFPTHDKILSNEGKELVDRILTGTAEQHGIRYQRIESIEV